MDHDHVHDQVHWTKSSYSGGSGTECVEAARLTTGALVRDSKRPHGPRLTFAGPAWAEFVGALRDGRM